MIRAERAAPDIAVGIVADGVAPVIELEPGQLWRSFPATTDAEVDALRAGLDAVGGSVSIVGASLDDWISPTQRRTEAERLEFLLPQLRAAHRVGAAGVRLPIGQAGEPLLQQLLPVLHDLDLVLFEEIQGQQTPDSPAARAAIETIAGIDDPHVRLLVDISMLMPSLPPSYLELLRAGGVPETLLQRLATDWREPGDERRGDRSCSARAACPPQVHTAFMNLLVRFGRSDAADLRGILPLVGAFHLKFWDLDDTDGRVSQPIRDLGAELAGTDFTGTLCSEWGGHEWLDDDAALTTRAHLALARTALGAGARWRPARRTPMTTGANMPDVLHVLILSGHMTREHDNEHRSFRVHNQWITTLLEDTGRFRVRVVEDPRGLGGGDHRQVRRRDRRVRRPRRLPREGRRVRRRDGCRAPALRARRGQGHRLVPRLGGAGGRLGLPRGVQRHARREAQRADRACARDRGARRC